MLASLVGSDWVWVALVVVVLFGGSQLPKLARNAGDAMKEFRKAHNEVLEADAVASAPLASAPVAAPLAAAPVVAVPVANAPAPIATAGAVPADDRVTLTRSELDALLADRETRSRASQPASPEA